MPRDPHRSLALAGRRRRTALGLAAIACVALGIDMAVAVDGAAGSPAQRVAERYGHDWAAGAYRAMCRLLAPGSRQAVSYSTFESDYRTAAATAGVAAITVGQASIVGGVTQPPRRIRTAIFGTLRLSERLSVQHVGLKDYVRWNPALRFPGLVDHQRLFVRLGPVARGRILAADGAQLSPNAAGFRRWVPRAQRLRAAWHRRASPSGHMVRPASG